MVILGNKSIVKVGRANAIQFCNILTVTFAWWSINYIYTISTCFIITWVMAIQVSEDRCYNYDFEYYVYANAMRHGSRRRCMTSNSYWTLHQLTGCKTPTCRYNWIVAGYPYECPRRRQFLKKLEIINEILRSFLKSCVGRWSSMVDGQAPSLFLHN